MADHFIFGLHRTQPFGAMLPTDQVAQVTGGNTGNLAFHEGLHLCLRDSLPTVQWHEHASHACASDDVAIVPAANQIGPHQNLAGLARQWDTMPCSFVVVGLGAQSTLDFATPIVPDGTRAWLRVIAGRSPSGGPNIAVRGAFTLALLQHLGLGEHAIILGCPSLFINPSPTLGHEIAAAIRPIRRVAVAAGHPGWRSLAPLEASLAAIVAETDGSYVGQSPLPMLQLCRGEARAMAEDDLADCHAHIAPAMTRDAFIAWSERHGRIFWDTQAWIEHYRAFDFAVGTRIHGVALALQAGIPAVCIVHDSRTRELCETMAIPHVLASEVAGGVTLADLPGLFRFHPGAFDANRRMLAARFVEFLEGNGLAPSDHLRALAG